MTDEVLVLVEIVTLWFHDLLRYVMTGFMDKSKADCAYILVFDGWLLMGMRWLWAI